MSGGPNDAAARSGGNLHDNVSAMAVYEEGGRPGATQNFSSGTDVTPTSQPNSSSTFGEAHQQLSNSNKPS